MLQRPEQTVLPPASDSSHWKTAVRSGAFNISESIYYGIRILKICEYFLEFFTFFFSEHLFSGKKTKQTLKSTFHHCVGVSI
jgi:hypothetical protein